MFCALRSSSKTLRALAEASSRRNVPARALGAVALPLFRSTESVPHAMKQNEGFSIPCRAYSLFPGPQIGPQLPPKEGEAAPEEENKEDGGSHTPDDFYDLPKGPTHKEMIAARRHYLKRQARRGLLPPSRPIRKPSF